jgi:hypothetical protein
MIRKKIQKYKKGLSANDKLFKFYFESCPARMVVGTAIESQQSLSHDNVYTTRSHDFLTLISFDKTKTN